MQIMIYMLAVFLVFKGIEINGVHPTAHQRASER
jgi:hypothetical protein